MERHEMFIMKSFAYYDAGMVAAVGPMLDHVYNVLRAFVWRSSKSGDKEMRKLNNNGLLVTRISQKKIGEHVGLSREQTNRHIALMKDLGWIKTIKPPRGGSTIYVLGRTQTIDNCEMDGFYADTWQRRLWDIICRQSKKEFGMDAKPTDLDITTRAEITKKFVTSTRKATKAPSRKKVARKKPTVRKKTNSKTSTSGTNGEALDPVIPTPPQTTEQVPLCDVNITGGVKSASQGVCHQHHTIEVNKEEVENDIELDKDLARGTSSPRVCTSTIAQTLSSTRGEVRDKTTENDVDFSSSSSSSIEGVGIKTTSSHEDDPVEDSRCNSEICTQQASSTISPATPRVVAAPAVERMANIDDEYRRVLGERQDRRQAKAQRRAARYKKGYVPKDTPVTRLRAVWENLMTEHFSGVVMERWKSRENGMMSQMLKNYDESIMEGALIYLIENWGEIQRRYFRGRGGMPSLGVLRKFSASLVPESQRWMEYHRLHNEVQAWFKANPDNFFPPDGLLDRYRAAQEAARTLGVID